MNQQLLGLLLVTLTLAGGLRADTVAGVSCLTPGAAYQTDDVSCNAAGAYGYATASVGTALTLSTSASDGTTVSAASYASAAQFGIRGISSTATAQSSADIGIVFDSTGDVRQGLLLVDFFTNEWTLPVNGSASQLLRIGSYSLDPNGANVTGVWLPIMLGAEFGFDFTQSLTAIGSAGSGVTTGSVYSSIVLHAFEADGVTEVQLFDPPGSPADLLTPEPAVWKLLATALVGLLCLVLLRR